MSRTSSMTVVASHQYGLLCQTLVLCSLLTWGLHDVLAEDSPSTPDAPPSRTEVTDAMLRAARFFNDEVSVEGGYLWQYSDDLTIREGEGQADNQTAWVQPPGTPAVGMALLRAWYATGDRYFLDCARRTGMAFVGGQLRSGGWHYHLRFDDEVRRNYDFCTDPKQEQTPRYDYTVLDDNTTQSALRFMIELDEALGFNDPTIHESVKYALDHLLAAQYPNGGFTQVFDAAAGDVSQFPVKPACYYAEGEPETHVKEYWRHYTLNDNLLRDMVQTLLVADQVYHETPYADDRYFEAACRIGDFLILAQMPEPQPAWAQQYDAQMRPAWARKFEPASVTGGESQSAIETLLYLYEQTGQRKYLEPIPRAISYLRRSMLDDGLIARFYELKTDRPLYFTKEYELTYSDADVPTHYAFKISSQLDGLQRRYDKLAATDPQTLARKARETGSKTLRPGTGTPSNSQIQATEKVLAALDKQGRWIEDGSLRYHDAPQVTRIIRCETFIKNLDTLSEYLRQAY